MAPKEGQNFKLILEAAGWYLACALVAIYVSKSAQVLYLAWPAAGVAPVFFWLYGKRVWPGILAAAFIGRTMLFLMFDKSGFELWGLSVAFAVIETCVPLLMVSIMRQYTGQVDLLSRLRHFSLFTGLVLFGDSMVGGLLETFFQSVFDSGEGAIFSVKWLSEHPLPSLVGATAMAPMILAWKTRVGQIDEYLSTARWVEGMVLSALLFAVAMVAVGPLAPTFGNIFPFSYLLLVFLVWASFRFSPKAIATWIALIGFGGLAGVGGVANGDVQFIPADVVTRQVILYLVAFGANFLAVNNHERRLAILAVTAAKKELELRVIERTAALQATEQQIRGMTENLPALLFQLEVGRDNVYRTSFMSGWVEPLTGLSRSEVEHDPRSFLGLSNVEGTSSLGDFICPVVDTLAPREGAIQLRLPDGRDKWVQVSCRGRRLADGGVLVDGALFDITDLKAFEETLNGIFEAAPIPLALYRMRDSVIVRCNQQFEVWSGVPEAQLIQQPFAPLYLDAARRHELENEIKDSGAIRDVELKLRNFVGAETDVLMSAQRIRYDGEFCVLAGIVNISEQKKLQADLLKLAAIDTLTGAANRRYFLELSDHEFRRAKRYQHPCIVAMVDADHFKRLNDTRGHAAGDAALIALAAIMKEMLRDSDIYGRLGGEEFGIVLPVTSPTDGKMIADRLRLAIAKNVIQSDGAEFSITVSIGLSILRPDDEKFDQVLARADQALYRAKQAGRNRVEADF